jgi:hypothetical protein
LLERFREGMHRVEADADHPAAPPSSAPDRRRIHT